MSLLSETTAPACSSCWIVNCQQSTMLTSYLSWEYERVRSGFVTAACHSIIAMCHKHPVPARQLPCDTQMMFTKQEQQLLFSPVFEHGSFWRHPRRLEFSSFVSVECLASIDRGISIIQLGHGSEIPNWISGKKGANITFIGAPVTLFSILSWCFRSTTLRYTTMWNYYNNEKNKIKSYIQ